MESFGVIVAASVERTDLAEDPERHGVDDPFVGGGTEHANRQTDDHRTVNLDVYASKASDAREAFVEEDRDGTLGFGQSVLTMAASRANSLAYTVKKSFMGTSWETSAIA